MTDFTDTLELLGHTHGFIALCTKPKDGQFTTLVGDPATVGAAASVSQSADTWFTVNSVQGPAGMRGRGGAEAVTRLAALWVDLDVKPGGCPTMEIAEQIIADLSVAIGYDPSVIIHSGHGLQPLWPIENGWISDTAVIGEDDFVDPIIDRAGAATLVKRWGRMVATIAAARKAEVDSLYDLPRILRVPGTVNYKGEPVQTYAEFPPGAPLTIDEIEERLDEFGVPAMESDKLLDEPMSLDALDWADETCAYVAHMVESWAADEPEARHPWMIAQATRLAAARRNGCITKAAHLDAQRQLERRMHQLCAAEGNTRRVSAAELKDAMAWGEHRISQVHDDHLRAELGAHEHNDVDVAIDYVDQSDIDRALAAVKRGDASFRDSAAEDDSVVRPESTQKKLARLDVGMAMPSGRLEEIEGDFWTCRESLNLVFQAGLARMVSPWAVLGSCMCRALAQVPPWIALPPIIGGRGSLNLFVAIIAPSGGGKDSSGEVAGELVSDDRLIEGSVGSGEGLAHYYKRREGKEWVDNTDGTHAVMFKVPEVDGLGSQAARTGSTLLSKLREAYSGQALEFGYADQTKKVPIKAHSYRLTMTVSVQPTKSGIILNDSAGGTPQRFVWLPALDKRLTAEHRHDDPIGQLALPPRSIWGLEELSLDVPQCVVDEVVTTREGVMQGRVDPLDGHAMLTREKVMVALAVIDGRTHVTTEDWDLSAVVMTVSDWRRRKLVDGLESEEMKEAEKSGRKMGAARAAATITESDVMLDKAIAWVVGALPKYIEKPPRGAEKLTLAEFNRQGHSALRKGGSDSYICRAFAALIAGGISGYDYDSDTGFISAKEKS